MSSNVGARLQIDEPMAVDGVVDSALRPIVRKIDKDGFYPENVLRRLGEVGAYGAHTGAPAHVGLPMAISDMASVSAVCMSTGFCMWCQDALAWYLAKSENQPLRQRLLDRVASGAQLGGTGLSNPMKAFSGIEPLALKGERALGGYKITGRLPWVSNIGPGHLFASVFALPDGRRVMATFDASDSAIKLMRSAEFIALEGTGTYTVLIKSAFVPDEDIIAEDAATFVPRIRQSFVLLQFGMGLGLARGAANAMKTHAATAANAAWLPLQPEIIFERAAVLEDRAATLAHTAADPSRAAFLDVLKTRLEVAELAMSATQSAALQAGAAGFIQGSDTNRRQREALFVGIVTPSIKHITMELARD